MVTSRCDRCARALLWTGATAALALASGASAERVPYIAGQFLAGDDQSVAAGEFSGDVRIGSVTIGHGTYRAEFNDLLEVAALRVSIDTTGEGAWTAVSADDLMHGDGPVRLALAADLDRLDFHTLLDALQGYHVSRVLWTDGSVPVRIDGLFTAAVSDDRPGDDDKTPEIILVSSVAESDVRVRGIIGGNADEPKLAETQCVVTADLWQVGATGMWIQLADDLSEEPRPVRMVGVDLSGDLGVDAESEVLGARVEMPAGEPGALTMYGATADVMAALRRDVPSVDVGAWSGVRSAGRGRIGIMPIRYVGLGGGGGFAGTPGTSSGSVRGFDRPLPPDDGDEPPDNNGGDGPPPVVPGPGSLVLIAVAGFLTGSRRRRR